MSPTSMLLSGARAVAFGFVHVIRNRLRVLPTVGLPRDLSPLAGAAAYASLGAVNGAGCSRS